MTVGIYIRVSTEEQVQEGYSIGAQKERLKAFCIAQGWNGFKFYIDEGISGRDMKRPQFKKLLKDVADGFVKTLLVYRLDRMTRSVRDLHDILDHLEKHDCVFRSATEIYDTSTAMGRMFITIVAAIAEWESSNLGERVIMGQIEKARQGEWAAPAPYGWYKDENHKLQINEKEIGAVKLMIEKIKEGYSFRQLSQYMSSTEYSPRRGYKWHIRTIMDLMHNPILYGAMRWKDQIYEDTHPGIITKEEFEKLQKIIHSRQNFKKRNINNPAIYQMKIICPYCQNRLSYERTKWTNKDGTQRASNRYRCQACALNGAEKVYSIGEDAINSSLIKYMKDVELEKHTEKEVVNEDEKKQIQQELDKIDRQRAKFQRAWANDDITDKEFSQRMEETKLRYEDLQSQLKTLGVQEEKLDPQLIKEYAKVFNNNFPLLNHSDKRDFVQSFIESINVQENPGHKKKQMRKEAIITEVNFY